jgi:hypothetical protein
MEHDGDPFYFGEVVGSQRSYHQPACHIVRNIQPRNRKRLRNWEEAVQLNLKPCPHCRPPYIERVEAAPAPELSAETERYVPKTGSNQISVVELGELRRMLLRLLDQIDDVKEKPKGEQIGARITRLQHSSVIPRDIAAFMRTITESRNAAEYENKQTTQTEWDLVALAWKAIEEWLPSRRNR